MQVQRHVKHTRILLVTNSVTKATAVNSRRQMANAQHHNIHCVYSWYQLCKLLELTTANKVIIILKLVYNS